MPPDSATLAVVLRSYLSALSVADCDTAATLTMPSAAAFTRQFCGPGHVTGYAISDTDPAMPGDGEVIFATEVTTAGGVIYPDGPKTLFFSLKQQTNGAWRITGGGTGP